MNADDKEMFSALEKDAIGEIMNISIGSSATAVSNMLQQRTDITTPKVEVVTSEEFEITSMEPAVAVEIEYVQGIEGKNIFVLKRSDIKSIVETLLMMEIPDDEFELNELNMSAVCEVMNQMMGAASTALATLLGEPVNISPPFAYEIENADDIKARYFVNDDLVVVVRFNLKIETILDSEFLAVMPIALAKRVVSMFTTLEDEMSDPPVEPGTPIPSEIPQTSAQLSQAPPPPQQGGQPQMTPPPEGLQAPPPYGYPPQAPPPYGYPPQQAPPPGYGYPPPEYQHQPAYYQAPPPQHMSEHQPRMIQVQDPYAQQFDYSSMHLAEAEGKNLDMLMTVPLEISVEIGRARKPIKEIIAFAQGTLVVLDKLAGEQVDLYVNNQCIAKGDVVVVDDSFGVRITKILDKNDLLKNK